jgi:hypothetical protein
VIGRRGRAEIEGPAGLYETIGMGRSELCRSHGMALSTLNCQLKKQREKRRSRCLLGSKSVEQSRLAAVELAAAVPMASVGESPSVIVQLSPSKRQSRLRCCDAGSTGECA